jgi:hypothetical protein
MPLNILIINRATNMCSSNADLIMNALASLSTSVSVNARVHTCSNFVGLTFPLYSLKPG